MSGVGQALRSGSFQGRSSKWHEIASRAIASASFFVRPKVIMLGCETILTRYPEGQSASNIGIKTTLNLRERRRPPLVISICKWSILDNDKSKSGTDQK
jgi:hypothetical protein